MSRKVVVVRAGPPKRGIFLDILVGLIGALLLAGAVYLTVSLPEDEVIPPQYRVNFDTVQEETAGDQCTGGSKCFLAPEDGVLEISFPVVEYNVFEIQVDITFLDDIEETEPDVLQVDLVAPNGTTYTLDPQATDYKAIERNPDAGSTDYYVYNRSHDSYKPVVTFRYVFGGKPEPYLLTGNETSQLFEIQQAVRFANNIDTTGTWKFRAQLLEAGDCYVPNSPPTSTGPTEKATLCQAATSSNSSGTDPSQAGVDPGNPIGLGKVTLTLYDVNVTEE